MKKIGLIFREVSENRIKNYLKQAHSFFIVKYSGLSSPDLTTLRTSLKNAKANFFVVKNSTARRALAGSGLKDMLGSVEGPCGLVFSKDEPVEVSRVLFNFNKEHQQLQMSGGMLKDKPLEKNDIEAMAKLPTKPVLQAQVVMALNSPIVKLAMVLNSTLRKFVCCIEQIKQKKGTPR